MKRFILIVVAVCPFSFGCNAFKDQVGDYVTSATLASVQQKIDSALTERGLEYRELKTLFLADKDGRVSPTSVLDNAKQFARDLISTELAKASAQLESRIIQETEARSGKTREEIVALRDKMDKDKDGLVSRDEFSREVKAQALQIGSGIKEDSKALVARLIDDVKSGTVSKDEMSRELDQYKQDVKGRIEEFWKWLIGAIGSIVSLYLGKQAVSSKGKGAFQARLDTLEKLTGLNLANGIVPPVQSSQTSQSQNSNA